MSLRHAILGFLSIQPFSGYDLKRYFDASIRHFWSADQAAIYRALTELAADGLVEQERIAQTARPDRKVYHLTPSGRSALDGWLATPTTPVARREPLLVKLFFAGRLAPEALTQLLEAERQSVEAELQGYREIVASIRETPGTSDDATLVGPLITLTNGIAAGVAHRDWLRGLLDQQRAGRLTTQTLFTTLDALLHEPTEAAPR